MPVAKGKGGKKRRRGKNIVVENTGLLEFEEGQAYGRIVKLLGNGRAHVECYIWQENKKTKVMEMNTKTCVGKIRGKLMKRMWMGNDDIVLVGLRDFQDDRVDIIHKYTYNDALKLRKLKYGIPNIKIDKYQNDSIDQCIFNEDDSEDDSQSNSDSESNNKSKNKNKRVEFVSYGNHNLIQSDESEESDENYEYQKQEVDEMGNLIENI